MTVFVDLAEPAQDAIYAALSAGVDGALATVRVTASPDTPPPLVMIDEIESENVGGKDEQAERLTVKIATIYRGGDRGQMLKIMHAVRAALDDGALADARAQFSRPSFLGQIVSGAGPDGVTFAGISSFEIYAEPA